MNKCWFYHVHVYCVYCTIAIHVYACLVPGVSREKKAIYKMINGQQHIRVGGGWLKVSEHQQQEVERAKRRQSFEHEVSRGGKDRVGAAR